jgi:hypothetical protein
MWLEHSKSFEPFFAEQKRKGRVLNLYSCSGPARLLDPYSYYRLQAWHCWHIGATGSFFWAFGDNSGASSWNEYLALRCGYTPLFLDPQTVVAGKQMEAIRESVEDYECFVMLRQAVDRAKAAGRSDAAVAKAESVLKDGVQRVVAAASDVKELRWSEKKDRTLADSVRKDVLELLSQLK